MFQNEPKEEPVDHVSEHGNEITMRDMIAFFRDLVIILVIVLFVRNFIASPFRISGNSMEENYHDKEFILVDKFSYADFGIFRVGDPKRGDVVILRPHASNGKEFYIKRVLGLPGDKIEFRDGEVFLVPSGQNTQVKISEPYLSPFNKGRTFLPNDVRQKAFEVPRGEYFVMGDNRNNSSDSRSCFRSCATSEIGHYLKRSDIVGKILLDLGYFKVFEEFSVNPFRITLANTVEWVLKPRLFETPGTWNYPEIEPSK